MSRKTDGLTKIELDQMRCLSETLDDGWLRTDEWIETVLDFEMFSEQLGQVTFDPHRWIWAIIALHRGIQGMMVLALKGSNDFKVLREKDVERWLSWYEDDRGDESPPHAKLADFLDLYRKIKGDKMLIYMHSQKFVPKGTQDFSIKHLHRLRNKIIHFKPQIWSLDLNSKGFPLWC